MLCYKLYLIKGEKEKIIEVNYLPNILKKYNIVTSFFNDYGLVFYLGNGSGRLHAILLTEERN